VGEKWNKSKLDLRQLEKEILTMSPRSKLFKVLKKTLSELGHWRNKNRGDPSKGYKISRSKISKSKDSQ
jgi:hypothetical protein